MNLASFETEGFWNSGVSHRNHLGWRNWDYMMDSSRRFILRDDASAPRIPIPLFVWYTASNEIIGLCHSFLLPILENPRADPKNVCMGGYSLFWDGTSRYSTCNLVPKILFHPEWTFNLVPSGKREDPGDEVGERLTWLGQAREFILIKTLSALPWGHWRQISHQSAPPSNRLFVITQILEDT